MTPIFNHFAQNCKIGRYFKHIRIPIAPLLYIDPKNGILEKNSGGLEMLPIITLLLVLTISLIITRIATVALTHTGLSRQSARFQARSAFSGVGFATHESEKVVNHPVRRKILMLLMLLGNAGLVTSISTLIISFVDLHTTVALWIRMVLLVSGILLLWAVASSRWVDRHLSNIISKMLDRYTQIDVFDYSNLLHLAGDYQIQEIFINDNDWVANRKLHEIRLQEEGILVLGLTRKNGTYIGAPNGQTTIYPDDTLIAYGKGSVLQRLDARKAGKIGDLLHAESVLKHQENTEKENMDTETESTQAE